MDAPASPGSLVVPLTPFPHNSMKLHKPLPGARQQLSVELAVCALVCALCFTCSPICHLQRTCCYVSTAPEWLKAAPLKSPCGRSSLPSLSSVPPSRSASAMEIYHQAFFPTPAMPPSSSTPRAPGQPSSCPQAPHRFLPLLLPPPLQALGYSRAAAAVRGCAYRLVPRVKPGELPFVGGATARQITQLLQTGTCSSLEAFR